MSLEEIKAMNGELSDLSFLDSPAGEKTERETIDIQVGLSFKINIRADHFIW